MKAVVAALAIFLILLAGCSRQQDDSGIGRTVLYESQGGFSPSIRTITITPEGAYSFQRKDMGDNIIETYQRRLTNEEIAEVKQLINSSEFKQVGESSNPRCPDGLTEHITLQAPPGMVLADLRVGGYCVDNPAFTKVVGKLYSYKK